MGARALAHGSHLYFAPGHYNPTTAQGEQLLAHELAHVLQQRSGRAGNPFGSGIALLRDPALEAEAERMSKPAVAQPKTSFAVQRKAAVIQRYWQGAHSRISSGDKMILVDKRHLFAKRDAIEEAAAALRQTGAVVTLVAGNERHDFASGQFYLVSPAVNAEAVAGKLWTRLRAKQSDGSYRSFADCFRTSATVSGINPGLQNQREELRLATGTIPVMSKLAARDHGVGDSPAARAAGSFFEYALPLFLQRALADEGVRNQLTDDIVTELDKYSKLPIGLTKSGRAPMVYKKILAHAPAKALFATTFGINESLAPAIGTAITQVNDQAEKEASQEDKWNFHWAGVIMRDGSDYVTLENCAVELDEATAEEIAANSDAFRENRTVTSGMYTKQDLINQRWYFKMHGTGGQSFHAENLLDTHATPSAITLPFAKAE
jgi:hypothetical protein